MLQKHGLKGTFFVPLENREQRPVMGSNELRALDDSFEIGGHTWTHRYLSSRLSHADLIREVPEAKQALEDLLGHGIEGFCYPGGTFDDRAVSVIREAGFTYARTTENLRFDLGHDRWEIPTTLQFFPHRANVLARNTLRFPSISKARFVTQRLFERDFLGFCTHVAEQCANADGVFHLWGHSWEIDQNNLWPALNELLGSLRRMATRTAYLRDVSQVA